MRLTSINQVPRGAILDGFSEEVTTPGFGKYFIHIYTKGIRRYFELTGWYTGKHIYSTSVNNDRAEAIRQVKSIADARVDMYRRERERVSNYPPGGRMEKEDSFIGKYSDTCEVVG